MPDIAIGLMARYPRLGTVKTRLAQAVGDERALESYKSMLNRACKLITSLNAAEFRRTAFVASAGDLGIFEADDPGFDDYLGQQGTDLGERMLKALETLLSMSGISKAILIGADCPGLSITHLRTAEASFESHDLILGPAVDGGYYLIGLKKVQPELFSEIKWGTSAVMKETLAVAETLRLSVGLLPEMRDLDDQHDLEYFNRMGLI